MRHWISILLLTLALAAPAAAGQRVLLAPGGDAVAPAKQEQAASVLAALRKQAAAEGTVRVIVGLRVPFAPEGELSEGERLAQRQEIASAITELRGRYSVAVAREPSAVRSYSSIPYIALRVTLDELNRLAADPLVISVTPDPQLRTSDVRSNKLIGVPEAWSEGFSGTGQAIAILDTGVDKTNPALVNKVVSEACYSANLCPGGQPSSTAPGSAAPCAAPDCAHGTAMAGIAAGKSTEIPGVARDASIIAIQVFSDDGANGIVANLSDVLAGMNRVYELRDSFNIASVNVSIEAGKFTENCDGQFPEGAAIVANLRSVGIATVAASGDDSAIDGLSAPACLSGVISVGAVTDAKQSVSCGTYNAADKVACFSNTAPFLTLLAPGVQIDAPDKNGTVTSFDGTSPAAAHVAGAFAVLKQKWPSASVDELLTRLQDTGKPVGDDRAPAIVKPRINIGAAVSTRTTIYFDRTGAGTGTVTITTTTGTTTCDDTCSVQAEQGSQLTATATADTFSRFAGWSGPCEGTNGCSFQVNGTTTLRAAFDAVDSATVAYTKAGNGGGRVSISTTTGTTNCQDSCDVKAEPGSTVTVTTAASPYSTFAGWSGACQGTGECRFVANGTVAVGATFDALPTVTYTKAGDGEGVVRIQASSGPTDCNSSCSVPVELSDTVTLTAAPAEGSRFVAWSGRCSGSGDCSFTADQTNKVGALFALNKPQTVTYEPSGNGAGSITIATDDTSKTCDRACSFEAKWGSTVRVTAQPAAGSAFAGWSGACSGLDGCSFIANQAITVGAAFVIPLQTVTYRKSGDGEGTVSFTADGLSQNCDRDCAFEIPLGRSLQVRARPADGSTFGGWSGACSGIDGCSFTVTGPTTVGAGFNAIPIRTITYAKAGTGNGKVSITTPTGTTDCTSSCSVNVLSGSTVTAAARSALGSAFVNWSGACNGSGPCRFTATASTSLTATFSTAQVRTLTYTKLGKGQGTVSFQAEGENASCSTSCNQRYNNGTVVTLTASPASGARFAGWSGACKGRGTCTVSMVAAKKVRANFSGK